METLLMRAPKEKANMKYTKFPTTEIAVVNTAMSTQWKAISKKI